MRFLSKKSDATPGEEELCARVLCAAVAAAREHHPAPPHEQPPPHPSDGGGGGGGADAMCAAFNALVRRRLQPRCHRFPHDHHDTCMYIERSKNANLVVYTAQLQDARSGQRVESGAGRACVLHGNNALHAAWVTLHPEHLQARQARGEGDTLGELTFIQRKLAYGCHTSCLGVDKYVALVQSKKAHKALESTASADGGGCDVAALTRDVCERWHRTFTPHLVTFVALPTWPLLLVTLPPTWSGSSGGDGTPPPPPSSSSAFPAPTSTVCVLLSCMHGEVAVLDKIYVKSVEPEHVYQLPSVEYIEVYGTSLRTGEPVYVKKVH